VPPGFDARLLERVFGVLKRAEHPVREGAKLARQWLDELAKSGLVASFSRLDERTFTFFANDR
jgi:hypothetical protein